MCPGFESRESHDFFFFIYLLIFFLCFLSLLLQCKFANSTLLSLLSFSYFITPYDAQASSAFSALILYTRAMKPFQKQVFSDREEFAHLAVFLHLRVDPENGRAVFTESIFIYHKTN